MQKIEMQYYLEIYLKSVGVFFKIKFAMNLIRQQGPLSYNGVRPGARQVWS